MKHPYAEDFRQAAKLEYEALQVKNTFEMIQCPPHMKPLPLKWVFTYKFDKAGYQQFLREQELSEYDIKHLNIHLITDFTSAHFKGCVDLAPGGAFFQRGREYVEQENKTTRAFYQPVHPDSTYAAIFLRPAKCHLLARLLLAQT